MNPHLHTTADLKDRMRQITGKTTKEMGIDAPHHNWTKETFQSLDDQDSASIYLSAAYGARSHVGFFANVALRFIFPSKTPDVSNPRKALHMALSCYEHSRTLNRDHESKSNVDALRSAIVGQHPGLRLAFVHDAALKVELSAIRKQAEREADVADETDTLSGIRGGHPVMVEMTKARLAQGMSRAELGLRAGTTSESILQFERGGDLPMSVVRSLCKELGTPLSIDTDYNHLVKHNFEDVKIQRNPALDETVSDLLQYVQKISGALSLDMLKEDSLLSDDDFHRALTSKDCTFFQCNALATATGMSLYADTDPESPVDDPNYPRFRNS